ncbi:hypothetical protein DF17_21935 [Streptomyces rimosus]|uniref:hypothetical protein n=1 Tax=Streptomyces rimosus TaxID=1927 RepID=UPI0004D8DA80|nr:hypothetical protein [Streptomyces rimosus]KEF04903.1 hypothetical protein DF17_21935 [Streptomyces rimosus]
MMFPARAMPVLVTLALLVPAAGSCTDRRDRHCDDRALTPAAALSAVQRPGPGGHGHGSVGKPNPHPNFRQHHGSNSRCH